MTAHSLAEARSAVIEADGDRSELKAQRDLRAALVAEGKRNLEGHGPLSPSQKARDAAIQQELERTNARIGALEAELDRERRLDGPSHSEFDHDAPALAMPALPSRTRAAIASLYPGVSADSEERVDNFRAGLQAALGGMPLLPQYLASTATERVDSEGGFAQAPDVGLGLFVRAAEASVWMRIGARVETMASSEKIINALADDDETDDEEAELKAEWTSEEGTATPQVAELRRVVLKAKKLMVVTKVTNELGEDAGQGYLAELEAALGRAIGKRFDRAALSGSGASMPLGILNAPATVEVAKESGQAAATFTWANAAKMWARLAPGSHEASWWLIHPTVLPQALSMTLPAGTGGVQPLGAFSVGGPTGYMLLSRPVVITSRVKVLGAKGDVILVDPTQIAIGIRRGISIARSEHAYFSSDSLGIRATFRGDSQPLWSAARTLVDSGGTVSPVVVLQAR